MEENLGIEQVSERWRTLARGEKISAGVLAVCAIVVLGLSAQRLYAGVNDPFSVSKTDVQEATKAVSNIDVQGRQLAESKRRDTDGDGLSDYDEENILGTSPYLADTDGDGMPDNVELALGESPNCARGTQCQGQIVDTTEIQKTQELFQPVTIDGTGDDLLAEFQRGVNGQREVIKGQTGSTSTDLEPALIRDPEEIRTALRESGEVDLNVLDQLSDADLLKLYDEALALTASNGVDAQGNSNP
ncbi:MAG: hypothetical protein NUV81_02305 [bacterium]|nr:hypothetical protein [bacterium]